MTQRTIALVQRDATVCHELASWLDQAGYATQLYTTLDGTYEALATQPPQAAIIELLFSDHRHGLDLVTFLKLHSHTRALPVLLTSDDTTLLNACRERMSERGIPALVTMPRPLHQARVLQVLEQMLVEG